MGVEIRWDIPDPDTTWNQVKIYKATSETGSYSLLTTVILDPSLYYDKDGSTTNWYKITYYDSSSALESTLSSAVQGSTGVSDTNYTHAKDVLKFLNLYTRIDTAETVGTGDGSAVTFSLDNKNVIQNSERIYEDSTLMVRNADYKLLEDDGSLEWTTAPTSGVALTATYWYSDIPGSEVKEDIRRAEEEINQKIGRTFYPSQTVTEIADSIDMTTDTSFLTYQTNRYIDEAQKTLPQAPEYFLQRTLKLKKWPIISVTSVTIGDDLVDSSYYDVINEIGVILLKKDASSTVFTKGEQNVTVVYVHGYTRVPALVQRLSTIIAARNVAMSRLLGSPSALSVSAANLQAMDAEIERLYDSMGRRLEAIRI